MGKTNDRTLKCYLCKIVMKCNKVSNLRRHMRLHGPFVQCFKCCECGTNFQNRSNMKIHWSRIHKDLADKNVPPKMISTSQRAASKIKIPFWNYLKRVVILMSTMLIGYRLVEPVEKTKKPNRNVGKKVPKPKSLQSFVEQKLFFGEPPVFVSKLLIPEVLNVTKKIESVTNDAPAILKAVGLNKLKYSPPKCYGKKKRLWTFEYCSDT